MQAGHNYQIFDNYEIFDQKSLVKIFITQHLSFFDHFSANSDRQRFFNHGENIFDSALFSRKMALLWVIFSIIWHYFWQKLALFAALFYVLEGDNPVFVLFFSICPVNCVQN